MHTLSKGSHMQNHHPTIQTVNITDFNAHLSSLMDEVAARQTRVLIEKEGKPVAAIISARDLRRFSNLEQERAERFKIIDELRDAFKDVDPEEIERETDRIIAQNRAEDRKRAAKTAASR